MSTSEQKVPLSVLLFHSAMQQRASLADFAGTLGLSVATLRAYLFEAGVRSRMRSKTVDRMAEVLHMSADEVRERAELLPFASQPFGEWLKERMQGRFTRASLCTATKISDSAMKNYLNGQTTPDPDNAMKLVDVLGADSLEVARLIVATELSRRGVELPLAASSQVTSTPVSTATMPAPTSAVDGVAATPVGSSVTDEAIINAYTEQ